MLSRIVAVTLAAAFSLAGTLVSAADTLRVSAIPDEHPAELLRKFNPLGSYLRQQLGMRVEFVTLADYDAVVDALADERIDLAWLGGFNLVQARLKRRDVLPLVQRAEDEKFTSKIISANPAVQSLQDLQGKTFAFGSLSSTSDSLMPRYFLLQHGIRPETFFSHTAYSAAQEATARWVQEGKADAGALSSSAWEQLLATGQVDPERVRVIATTAPYFDYSWSVRGKLEPALREQIRQAFLQLNPDNAQHQAILELQGASRFIETRPENYAELEQAAHAAGLLR